MSVLSDPWRLCCPKCGSHTLLAKTNGWRCRGCKTNLDKIEDKRRKRLVSRQELTG